MMSTEYIGPTRRRSMSKARAARVFLAHDGKCELCGRKIVEGEAWEVEHRVPLNLGGADDDANTYPAHVKCHRMKSRGDKAAIAKRNRVVTAGWKGGRKSRFPGSKNSGLKRRMDGTVVSRATGLPVGKDGA